MLKAAFFLGEDENGIHTMPLFGPADREFEKTAAPTLLPEVSRYISSLRPRPDAQYVLLNAMGAGEYWGSNINGDYFSEAALIHAPNDWTGNPLLDKQKAEEWHYGFPTFYSAHPYAHHRNKDASRAFGEVELAAWNPRMKRVELVTRVDEDKCLKFGGSGVWDKLKMGGHPDVSMGCKVPYDTCSVCLDWDTYRKAQATFRPGQDKTPGDAVLRMHKALKQKNGHGIRGVSITRADYCEHAKKSMNRILSDGRKVFVYNDYPKFFDISFVFIGADKTAKVMMKIASAGQNFWDIGSSAELAEKLGYHDGDDELLPAFAPQGTAQEKVAAPTEEALKVAFLGKQARNKDAEIVKDVVPSQFTGKAVPVLTASERDLPNDILSALGNSPLEEALSTPSALGMVLRPREFQRIVLIQMGKGSMADDLDARSQVFPKVDETLDVPMGPSFFSPVLAKLLAPLLADRSALGPSIEKRVLVVASPAEGKKKAASSHSSNLLRKMGAAYNGYRKALMDLVTHSQDLVASASVPGNLFHKLSSAPVDSLFTPLTVSYLKLAFWDELQDVTETPATVERDTPRGTRGLLLKIPGGY